MFERFTDAARAAVVGAQTEARGARARLDRHRAPAARRGAATGPAGRPAAGRARADPRPVAAPRCVTTLGGHHDDGSALRDLGIDLDAVGRRVEEQFGPGALDRQPATRAPRPPWPAAAVRRGRPEGLRTGHIPFSRSAKKGLELALRESVAPRLARDPGRRTSCSA